MSDAARRGLDGAVETLDLAVLRLRDEQLAED